MDVLTKSLSSDTVDHFQLTRSHYLYINGSARHVFKSVMDLVLFYQKNHLPKKYCMLKFPIEIISRLDFIHRLPSPPQVKYMFRVKNFVNPKSLTVTGGSPIPATVKLLQIGAKAFTPIVVILPNVSIFLIKAWWWWWWWW